MKKESLRIMLVDDSPAENFYHQRVIAKHNAENVIITNTSGLKALEYLKSKGNEDARLDLIFLDINMPGMNGWEFLDQYALLSDKLHSRATIVMLSTSENPDDIARAKASSLVSGYISKPLTEEMLNDIISEHLNGAKKASEV